MSAWKIATRYTEIARARLLADREKRAAAIVLLEQQLIERDPARQLHRLLDEITDPDRYSSHRGLVGRIHDDLRRLSSQLAHARDNDRNALRRIILYIDDLDRCVSSRVVEVLQAINLLLGMDLFVVVVAVDPRWLLQALDEQHGRLLAARPAPVADVRPAPGDHSRPLDYLDKIFHVPYAVRPMGGNAQSLLRDLLPSVSDSPRDGDEFAGEAASATFPSLAPEDGDRPVAEPSATPPLSTGAASAARPASPTLPAGSGISVPAPPVIRRPLPPVVRSLELERHEADFLPRVGALLPTPRGIKKLANTYRLLRFSIAEDHLGDFLGRPEEGGPYQAAALLLAAITARPERAREFLDELGRCDPGRDIVEHLDVVSNPLFSEMAAVIRTSRASGVAVCGSTQTFQEWAGVVARYSFDTYDLFDERLAIEGRL